MRYIYNYENVSDPTMIDSIISAFLILGNMTGAIIGLYITNNYSVMKITMSLNILIIISIFISLGPNI